MSSFVENINKLANSLPDGGMKEVFDAVSLMILNLSNLNIVATNLPNINAVNDNKHNIDTIVSIQAMLSSIYADAAKLTSLYNDKATLDSLYSNKELFDAIYAIIEKIETVNENIGDININAINIEQIKDAFKNASDAISARDQALIFRNEAESFRNEANIIAGGASVATEIRFLDLVTLEEWRTNVTEELSELLTLLDNAKVLLEQELQNHINDTENPHGVTPSQIGLGNVDNTSDEEKDVRSATKLKTPIKINGIDFDGSTNITTLSKAHIQIAGSTTLSDDVIVNLTLDESVLANNGVIQYASGVDSKGKCVLNLSFSNEIKEGYTFYVRNAGMNSAKSKVVVNSSINIKKKWSATTSYPNMDVVSPLTTSQLSVIKFTVMREGAGTVLLAQSAISYTDLEEIYTKISDTTYPIRIGMMASCDVADLDFLGKMSPFTFATKVTVTASNAAYAPPANVKAMIIIAIGGGGGGCGGSVGYGASVGGGDCGQISIAFYRPMLGDTLKITIGAGGAAGIGGTWGTGDQSGQNGGDTSVKVNNATLGIVDNEINVAYGGVGGFGGFSSGNGEYVTPSMPRLNSYFLNGLMGTGSDGATKFAGYGGASNGYGANGGKGGNSASTCTAGAAGTANTGAGGGGGAVYGTAKSNGGAGGSGVVLIFY